jgi:chemotaxis protein CheC
MVSPRCCWTPPGWLGDAEEDPVHAREPDWTGLTSLQLDALREVANIGAGHAATALSSMTGEVIMIDVPAVCIRQLDEVAEVLGPPETVVSAVGMRVQGDLTGQTLMILPLGAARRLCDLLLRRERGTTGEFGLMEQSSLKETGNIITSAYLNALSDFLGMMLVPSVPALVTDYVGAVLVGASLQLGRAQEMVFCVDTSFRVESAAEVLRGEFVLMPDGASLDAIFDAIRLR